MYFGRCFKISRQLSAVSFEPNGVECKTRQASVTPTRCEVRGARCEVQGARCKVRGARCEVQGARCEVQGARYELRGIVGVKFISREVFRPPDFSQTRKQK